MTTAEILSWIGSALTSSILIPQSYKIIKTKDTQSLSIYMYIIFILSSSTWLTYSILSSIPAITVTNSIGLSLASTIAIIKTRNIIIKGEKA